VPTFSITDLPPEAACRDSFLDGGIEVLSRSGLHPVERALLGVSARFAPAARHLVTGNRTGVLPLALHSLAPSSSVVAHDFDLHHLRAVARNLARNGMPQEDFPRTPFVQSTTPLALSCLDRLPDGPFDVAWLQASRRDTAAEVARAWLQALHGALLEGGRCVVAVDGPIAWMQETMRGVFGKVSVLPPRDDASVLVARRAGGLRKRRSFSATFEATLPDGQPAMTFTTIPGVFAHRRPDAGGLALAEVAARRMGKVDRLLDLGCGCGLVGLLLARHAGHVALVDSDARAFAATLANAEANGLADRCTVVLDDEGFGGGSPFDVVVGNPPYYSDFAIAGRFIREAGEVLRPGGLAFMVAKNARQHAEMLESSVGPCTIEHRRGYQVAVAVRRSDGPP
jgi:16S rRNA G1207 methylase RsmC